MSDYLADAIAKTKTVLPRLAALLSTWMVSQLSVSCIDMIVVLLTATSK